VPNRDLSQAFAVVNGAPVKLDASGAGHRQLAGTSSSRRQASGLRFADARADHRPGALAADRDRADQRLR